MCFFKIISKVSQNNGNVLYVWGKEGENKELVNITREMYSDITHSYVVKEISNAKLTFTHYNNLMKIKQNYDLVIF